MPELLRTGVERIAYKAKGFATGKTVTAYIWSPTLVKSLEQALTELEDGIYYLDYNFSTEGSHIGIFYEDGVPQTFTTFRVTDIESMIKRFTLTRILAAPRALELLAKSVGHYYRGQVGTTIVMARFAGNPTDVQLFATYYYPDGSVWMEDQEMIPVGVSGLYSHDFLIPADVPQGVYKVKFRAVKSIAAQELIDNFTQADGVPVNWTIFDGVWNVVNNILKQTASSYAYLHWSDPLSVQWSDYSFETMVKADTDVTNFLFGVMARYMSRTKAYVFYYSKYRNMLCLDKGTSSVKETPKTLVYNQLYKFKIELVGPIVKCYLDDTLEFEWMDLDPLLAGTATLYCAGPTSFDDVKITIPAQEYQEFEITDFKIDDTIKDMVDELETGEKPLQKAYFEV